MGRRPKEQNITLKYNGSLDGAKTIFLHYGIGDNWESVADAKMRKLKYCYKTEVTIPTGVDMNFCFRDADGNWDNNYGNNYTYNSVNQETPVYEWVDISPIAKKK